MLTSWFSFNPFNVFEYGLTGVFLFIDGIVYWCVSKLFSLFVALAGAEIITSDMYAEIVQRFEVIIGVVMLFYIAYALLKSIINPDELSKNTSGIVKNFIITIVLLTIVPVIFDYAFRIQNVIITENKIGILLFGDEASNKGIENIGNKAALTTLEAFLEIDGNLVGTEIISEDNEPVKWSDMEEAIIENAYSDGFMAITHWVEPVHSENNASYIPIISTFCGGFLIYVLVSFCLDLGVRVVKLAFYQIISPVPIMMRILPEKKSVFDNWVKATLSTFLEVFIRLFIMWIVVYLVDLISDAFVEGTLNLNTPTGDIGTFGLIIIILGLFAFAKQAPKLISDVIGIDGGNLKLGIKDKLSNNYIGGKMLTGAASSLVGGATGFLGGAHSSLMNGGSLWKGGLAGGVSGFKGKGNQFGKQMQSIYSMTGGKGKAGFFGGRAYFDAKAHNIQEAAKKNMKDAYKAEQASKVADFESSKQFQNVMQNYHNEQIASAQDSVYEAERLYTEQVSAAQNKVNNVENLINENRRIRSDFENSAEYNGIMTRYYNQASSEANAQLRERMHEFSATPEGRAKFQQEREALIQKLQKQYTYQELAANASKGLSSEAGKDYVSAMSSAKQLNDQLADAYRELDKVQVANEKAYEEAEQRLAEVQANNASAYEEAKKYFTDGEGNKTKTGKAYKSSVDYLAEEKRKADIKDYLKSEEGRREVAVRKEAEKALKEEEKNGGASKPKDDKK